MTSQRLPHSRDEPLPIRKLSPSARRQCARYLQNMKHLLLVGFGGFIGSVSRYALSAWIGAAHPSNVFPWGTFCVNILGCFLIGLMYGLSERSSIFTLELRYLLITGLLGGFTTFSAFSIETLNLWQRGDWMLGSAYAVGSVALGVLATSGGLILLRLF